MNRGMRLSLMSVSVVLGVTALLTAGQSHADNSLAAKIANADVGYGEYLSGECVTCHQKSGQSRGIPAIAGLEAETFVSIMNKELENKVMQMVAGRLDDEQIISLAAYFSKLPSK
jgi:cytochrome c